jgi:GNAT superfamily N-acetyltransferase
MAVSLARDGHTLGCYEIPMTILIRALGEGDIDAAERLRRLAFGTLFGLPDPASFRGDAGLLAARRWAFPEGGVVAEENGAVIGVAMANNWGSLGVFGPVAVHPEHWRRGVARLLLDAAMPVFDQWRSRVVGLFTFPERPSHVRLYQSFGFWPRALTAIMTRDITGPSAVPEALSLADHAAERADLVAQGAALTDTIFPGLDLTREIDMVIAQALGDVIMLMEGSRVMGFALCHSGKGSEAGTGRSYIKFAAIRPGPQAPLLLVRLIEACNDFAYRRGATQLSAGVNLGRMDAYRLLMAQGFRATLQGVAMHRPWVEAYDRPDIFVIDDWR